MNKSVENFYDNNQDRIHEAWEECLSNMQDSYEHIRMVSNSDACFWEFVEEMMDSESQEGA